MKKKKLHASKWNWLKQCTNYDPSVGHATKYYHMKKKVG